MDEVIELKERIGILERENRQLHARNSALTQFRTQRNLQIQGLESQIIRMTENAIVKEQELKDEISNINETQEVRDKDTQETLKAQKELLHHLANCLNATIKDEEVQNIRPVTMKNGIVSEVGYVKRDDVEFDVERPNPEARWCVKITLPIPF